MITHVSDTASNTNIPKRIKDKLSQVIDRHQSNERVFRIGGWVTLVMIAILLMVSIDLMIEIESTASRIGGWMVAVASVVLLAGLWQRSLQRPLTWLDAAWRLESVRPAMEERLTSTVELLGHDRLIPSTVESTSIGNPAIRFSRPQVINKGYSPQLIAALSREATHQIALVDCDDVPVRANWPVHVAVGCSITVFLFVAMANPEAVACSLRNWMMPWTTPIYPLLKADVLPGDTMIAEGEDLEFSTQSFHRGTLPLLEYWTEDSSDSSSAPASIMTRDLVEVASPATLGRSSGPQLCTTLTALSADTTYRLRLGKRVSRSYRVRVLPRPEILTVTARVAFPAYTDLPTETYIDPSAVIPVLSGSEVEIRVTGDQYAQQAELRWLDTDRRSEVSSNFCFVFNCIEPKQMVGEIRLKSVDGVYSTSLPIKIDVHSDQPPHIELLDPTLLRFPMSRGRELAVHYNASDDLNVEQVELFFQATDAPNNDPPQRILAPLEIAPQRDRFRVQGTVFVGFDRLPEQSKGATVWLRASDNRSDPFGGPQIAESPRIVIDFQNTDATPLEQRLAAEQQAIEQALQDSRRELGEAHERTRQLAEKLEDNNREASDVTINKEMITPELDDARGQINASRRSAELLAEGLAQANSNYDDLVSATQKLIEEHIDSANQQIDRAALTGNPQGKLKSAIQAKDQLEQAINDLDEIESQIQQKTAALRTAAKLEDLARQQQKLADEAEASGKSGDAKADRDTAPVSIPESPSSDWKRRQERVADDLAAMVASVDDEINVGDKSNGGDNINSEDNNKGDGSRQNRQWQQQAETARQLAERAERLAEDWDQTNEQKSGPIPDQSDQPKTGSASQGEQLAQQIGQLQEEAAKLARQSLPNKATQERLDSAQQDLKRSIDKAEQQAMASEQGQQAPATQQPEQQQRGQQQPDQQQPGRPQPEQQPLGKQQLGQQQPEQVQPEQQLPGQQRSEQQQPGQQQPTRQQPDQRQAGKPAEARDQTPADLLREASKALHSVCKSCLQGSSGQQPVSQQDLADAQRQCDAAAQAVNRDGAKQNAREAAKTLSRIADQAASETGLRKNCDKCRNSGDGQAGQSVPSQRPGGKSSGIKDIVEQSFEQLPLRGESSSGWTRAKRQLRNGVLDGREALIPEAFRDVVTDYFQALSKSVNDDQSRPDNSDSPASGSESNDAKVIDSNGALP